MEQLLVQINLRWTGHVGRMDNNKRNYSLDCRKVVETDRPKQRCTKAKFEEKRLKAVLYTCPRQTDRPGTCPRQTDLAQHVQDRQTWHNMSKTDIPGTTCPRQTDLAQHVQDRQTWHNMNRAGSHSCTCNGQRKSGPRFSTESKIGWSMVLNGQQNRVVHGPQRTAK